MDEKIAMAAAMKRAGADDSLVLHASTADYITVLDTELHNKYY
jgi:hypothetical protein